MNPIVVCHTIKLLHKGEGSSLVKEPPVIMKQDIDVDLTTSPSRSILAESIYSVRTMIMALALICCYHRKLLRLLNEIDIPGGAHHAGNEIKVNIKNELFTKTKEKPDSQVSAGVETGRELNRQLENWLGAATSNIGHTRAIIAPHAGYAYSGKCAAYAYRQIDAKHVDRVFILGPSHHVYLNGCAVSQCSKYRTPLYNLTIDQKVNQELMDTNLFEVMSISTDEAEHSIEMHLPYIAKVMESRQDNFTVVPILVGSLSPSDQAAYGKILAKYLADPRNLFIVSSDFCHWGPRFRFTSYDRSVGEIYQSIESLDKEAMNIIESLNPHHFNEYLKRTKNTICGRHPIAVMLQAAEHFRQMNNHSAEFKFLNYAQSNQCHTMNDSSVSYAAGALLIKPNS